MSEYGYPQGSLFLWGTKWYRKFIWGIGVGYLPTGFEYYNEVNNSNLNTNGYFFNSDRIGIGFKLEMPISIITINKYEVGEDFEEYYKEIENEKTLHISPSIGLNILYLHLTQPKEEVTNNFIYINNINPSFLVQPYILLSLKNKNIEYASLSVKLAIGLINAEKLSVLRDEIKLDYYSTNSNIEISICKNINFYYTKNPYPKQRKLNGNYNGNCP